MTPRKKGQIAKFKKALERENPEQLYVVLDIFEDDERPRAEIQALNTSLAFPPINTVRLSDLEVVEIDTDELIGYNATIIKSDNTYVKGKVIDVDKQKINLDLTEGISGVETNVYLTIIDKNGNHHHGILFVI